MADFGRSSDLLQIGGNKVTARQVVNVLGRWNASEDWDSIGRTGRMDDYSSGDYYDDDVQTLRTNFSSGAAYYMARRPQRRAFCKTYGLVQRWAHAENVAMLPFTDEALASSVGATVEELNAEPIDELAAQVVFDALCGSMSGVVEQERCDEMRATFVTSSGSFDEEAFSFALDEARGTISGALLVFPGLPILVVGLVANKWSPVALASLSGIASQVQASVDESGPAALLLPTWAALGALFTVLIGTNTAPGVLRRWVVGVDADAERQLDYKERAILEQDELYLQKMARRKRGEEERVVVDTNMGMGNYLRRVLSADFVASSFRRTLTPPKDDSAATRQRMRSTPGSKRAGDKDFSIR